MRDKILARLARLESICAAPITDEQARQTKAAMQSRLDRIAANMTEAERQHYLNTISPEAIEEFICRMSRGTPGAKLRAWADDVISSIRGEQEAQR